MTYPDGGSVGPTLINPQFAFGVSLHDVVEIYRDESGAAWAVRVARRGRVNTVPVVLDGTAHFSGIDGLAMVRAISRTTPETD
jgi:hypothetical protein